MKITAGTMAVLLALSLGVAGCSGKEESAEESQGTMENSTGSMQGAGGGHEAASDEATDSGMMSGDAGSSGNAPAEPAPAEGQ